MQFAANGASRIAATCASTSLPVSVPGPTTTSAPTRPSAATDDPTIASGAWAANAAVLDDVDSRAGAVRSERRRRRL